MFLHRCRQYAVEFHQSTLRIDFQAGIRASMHDVQDSLDGPRHSSCEEISAFLRKLRVVAKLAFEKCHERCAKWASVLGVAVQPLATAGRRTRRSSAGAGLLPRNVCPAADDARDPWYDARGGLRAALSARSPSAIKVAPPEPLSPRSSSPCKNPGVRGDNTPAPADASKAGKCTWPAPPPYRSVSYDGLGAPLTLLEAALACYDAAQQSRSWQTQLSPRDPVSNRGGLEVERAEREQEVEDLEGRGGGAHLLARLAGPEMLRASGRAGYAAVCPHYSSSLWTSAGETAASHPVSGVALMLTTNLYHQAHREGACRAPPGADSRDQSPPFCQNQVTRAPRLSNEVVSFDSTDVDKPLRHPPSLPASPLYRLSVR